MKTVLKKVNEDLYLSSIKKTDGNTQYQYSPNIKDALIYSSKGVANDIARFLDGVEAITLHKAKGDADG